MSVAFWVAAEVDRAIDYGQRAWPWPPRSNMSVSRPWRISAWVGLLHAGDYARAIESLERNVATLQGDLLYERTGSTNTVAASSAPG